MQKPARACPRFSLNGVSAPSPKYTDPRSRPTRRIAMMRDGLGLSARSEGRTGVRSAELQVLLSRIAQGSRPALAELYDLASRQVFALALRIVKDQQIAEEVVLDVFLQVWRRASSFDPARGRAFGWILTIARSRALDALRSRTVHGAREERLCQGHGLCDGGSTPPERAAEGDLGLR